MQMVNLYQDPLGENIFSDTMEMSRSQALGKSNAHERRETQLLGRIEELEGQLRKCRLDVRTLLDHCKYTCTIGHTECVKYCAEHQ